MEEKFTPRNIKHIESHQVIIFGSNTKGIHGKGLAKICCKKFGANYGQAKGLQGQSYAIITKDLSKGRRSISLKYIEEQVKELYSFARNNSNKEFLVTKIGCGLGGFSINEIKSIFNSLQSIKPKNVILPKEFSKEKV